MGATLRPTRLEIRQWLHHVLQHSCHVEYYLHELNIGAGDLQRPHDLVGPGNKFEWLVIQGFAIQGRDPYNPEFFNQYVEPARQLHRKGQRHHLMWHAPTRRTTADDLRLSAVDAVCSLLEPRKYQGGAHTFTQIRQIAVNERNPPHHRRWMLDVVAEMEPLPRPDLRAITSLDVIPNIGLPDKIYNSLLDIVEKTRRLLASQHGVGV